MAAPAVSASSVADRRQALLIVCVLALSALCWLALAVWGHSPWVHYAHALGHQGHHLEAHSPLAVFAFFVAGWTLMTAAMMLPTTVQLLALFQRVVRGRSDATLLVALVVGGYLAIWLGFGIAARLGIEGIYRAIASMPRLGSSMQVLAIGTLALAGIYQFTPLKYRCLDRCRSPFSFIVEHWRGRDERRHAFMLGVHNGLFCIGCCWTLMVLMFPLGAGNMAWMLALGIAMAVEKNLRWGRRFAKPLGVALLIAAVVFAAQ